MCSLARRIEKSAYCGGGEILEVWGGGKAVVRESFDRTLGRHQACCSVAGRSPVPSRRVRYVIGVAMHRIPSTFGSRSAQIMLLLKRSRGGL